MSMQNECIYGYGFWNETSREYLRKFILKHNDTVKLLVRGQEVLEYTMNCNPKEFNPEKDFWNWINEATEDLGFGGLIADVMRKETGISFEYRRSPEEQGAIILAPQYPWQLSSAEKKLTKKDLDRIIGKYMEELGKLHKTEFIRIEYYG